MKSRRFGGTSFPKSLNTESQMVVMELKCQSCGHRFENAVLDRDDPHEREQQGSPIRCQRCNSSLIEPVRAIRKAS